MESMVRNASGCCVEFLPLQSGMKRISACLRHGIGWDKSHFLRLEGNSAKFRNRDQSAPGLGSVSCRNGFDALGSVSQPPHHCSTKHHVPIYWETSPSARHHRPAADLTESPRETPIRRNELLSARRTNGPKTCLNPIREPALDG